MFRAQTIFSRMFKPSFQNVKRYNSTSPRDEKVVLLRLWSKEQRKEFDDGLIKSVFYFGGASIAAFSAVGTGLWIAAFMEERNKK